jgi:folate-dependent phosphoribosylglycinamide formyltransferase PurN
MSGLVLLARDGLSTRVAFHALDPEFGIREAVVEDPVPYGAFLSRRAQRYGWAVVIGQLAFRAAVVPLLRWRAKPRRQEILAAHGLRDAPLDPARVTRVPSVNSAECIARLRQLEPDVVFVSGTRIVSAEVLASIPAPFVNVHAGITPLYRGVHGAYWALVQGDRDHCGVTVHLLDRHIDTGPILYQQRIEPTEQDDFTTYPLLQLAAGLPVLKQAMRDLQAGRRQTLDPPAGASRYWTHPTLFEYLRHRRRGVR